MRWNRTARLNAQAFSKSYFIAKSMELNISLINHFFLDMLAILLFNKCRDDSDVDCETPQAAQFSGLSNIQMTHAANAAHPQGQQSLNAGFTAPRTVKGAYQNA